MIEYKPGDAVIYLRGDNSGEVELGIVKRVTDRGCFVRYHMGDTAAHTPFEFLQPIKNSYAFNIIRKDVNNTYQTQHARQIAASIIDKIEEFCEDGAPTIKVDLTEHTDDSALIFGTTYYNMEDAFTELIENTEVEIDG